MLRTLAFTPLLLGSLLCVTACSEDSPEPTPPDATPQCAGTPAFSSVEVSSTTLAAGETFDITFSVDHFHFSGGDGHSDHVPKDGHSHGGGGHSHGGGGHMHGDGGHMHGDGGHMHGDGGHMHDDGAHDHDHDHDHDGSSAAAADGCMKGHVHLYVDDLMTNPLAMIITPSATLQIPADMAPGNHQLIARVHDATHRIVEPEVVETIDIVVE